MSVAMQSELIVPKTMRAVCQSVYGGPEVLEVAETKVPSVGAGDVLVRVVAAGVDRGVWHIMTGKPYMMCVMGFGFRGPRHPVRGMDVAGTVVAVGRDVTQFGIGDEVFGTTIGAGAFAEYACLKESQLALKPNRLSFVEAAALPVSGVAALQAVTKATKVEPGHGVLVVGASGGVGGFIVQLAKHLGAIVTGVASTEKLDRVIEMGADHVIDYRTGKIGNAPNNFDVVFDIGGNRSLRELRSVLKPRGALLIVGGENGGNWFGGIDRQLRAAFLSCFTKQTLKGLISTVGQNDLIELRKLAQESAIRPFVDRVFGIDECRQAMEYLVDGKVTGKVVLQVDPS